MNPEITPAMNGVALLNPKELFSPLEDLASTPEEWRTLFTETIETIQATLNRYNPVEVIAKTATQTMVNAHARRKAVEKGDLKAVHDTLTEVVDVELAQAFALRRSIRRHRTPASPKSMSRFFPLMGKATHAFSKMQFPTEINEREAIVHKIRLQTIYGRNSFYWQDCQTVVLDILRRVDQKSNSEKSATNYSKVFDNLFAVKKSVEDRFDTFRDHLGSTFEAKAVEQCLPAIEFFCGISPMAARAWALCKRKCQTVDDYRWAALQLSELGNSWIYTLEKRDLVEAFGLDGFENFLRLSLKFGDLADSNPEHLFLSNPIWGKPFIALDDERLFLPIPTLIYAFPFLIIEGMISGNRAIKRAYFQARDSFLEEAVERLLKEAMPSARVYRGVEWRKDGAASTFENDVVALLGNTIFVFEAKSGRLDQVARRGGYLSLVNNFKELFVEPAKQAAGLESYLNGEGKNAQLWVKQTGESIDLDLGTPKVVHTFSICIESYAALSSAKHNMTALGAIREGEPWSPVLSIGELMMLWRHLDTELSFFHYLTRRATLESYVDFEGDEQDILSLYLINGLRIDPEAIKGHRLRFFEIDNVVRIEKTPNSDRTRFEIIGAKLSWYWAGVLREIYENKAMRHRFDVAQVILNQLDDALLEIEEIGRKWKTALSGKKDGDIIIARVEMGDRVFVLAYYLTKLPFTDDAWRERSRTVAREGAAGFGGSDCVTLMRWKKSKSKFYDGVSFHRMKLVETRDRPPAISPGRLGLPPEEGRGV